MPYWNTKNVKRWAVSWAKQDLATDPVLGFISCFQCKENTNVSLTHTKVHVTNVQQFITWKSLHIKRMHNYSVIYPSHTMYAGMMSTYEFAQFSIYTVFATINLWETSTVLPVSRKSLQIYARQLDFMFGLCSHLPFQWVQVSTVEYQDCVEGRSQYLSANLQ